MTDKELLAALLRNDFTSFAKRGFRELNPNVELTWNWHLDAIVHFLEKLASKEIRRGILTMPPRSLKSELCSVLLPAFLLGLDPTMKIICVSYSQPLASDLSRKFRRITSALWYRELFPRFQLDKDAEEHISTTMGGMRLATSTGGVVTGFGGSLIIVDDPMKPDDAPSEAERKKVIRYFNETLYSRFDDRATGAMLIVMQRLHEEDLAGHLLSGGAWDHLSLPAIAQEAESVPIGSGRFHHREPGDLLDPRRLPLSELDDIKVRLGSTMFEAQYQQTPIPDGGNIIKREWLRFYACPPPLNDSRIMQSWDTAYKGDVRHDYSVCTTWAERKGQHYLLDVFRKKMEYPELLSAAGTLFGKYRPAAVRVEDQGSGTVLVQQLKQAGVPAIPWPANRDKISRFQATAPTFQAGCIHLPQEADWLVDLLHEVLGFPGTKHDDQIDSISQYLAFSRDHNGAGLMYDMGWDEPLPTMGSIANMIQARHELFRPGPRLSAP